MNQKNKGKNRVVGSRWETGRFRVEASPRAGRGGQASPAGPGACRQAGPAPVAAAPKPAPRAAHAPPQAPAPAPVAHAAAKAAPDHAPIKSAPVAPAPAAIHAAPEKAAAPVVAVPAAAESKSGSAAGVAAAWSQAWPGKSFELLNESSKALMDFATALSKAKTPTEVVELQSKFASQHLDRFMRLSSEITSLPKFFFFKA